MSVVLEVVNLQTHFFTRAGVVKAVDGVSFSIERGQVLGLVGESGSGKSITGFSILGLIDEPGRILPTSSIKLSGMELVGLPEFDLRQVRGKRIAMVFQDPMATLSPVLSIATQMTLAIKAHDRVSDTAARARAIDVLTRVGIPGAASRIDGYPHQFSGGMRQRVAIAIALLHGSELLIADEPTTALDVSIQAQILAEMRRLVDETGSTMIWISHDLATVSSLADQIAVMYAGRIVESGPSAAVLGTPGHPYTAGLLASIPALAEPGQPLPNIPGSTPSLLALPAGCAFAPRCASRSAVCDAAAPALKVTGDAAVRCHHPLAAPTGAAA